MNPLQPFTSLSSISEAKKPDRAYIQQLKNSELTGNHWDSFN